MATGDVTMSIAVEGGVTKSATFKSATRTKSKLYLDIDSDADWQVFVINKAAGLSVDHANKQLAAEVSYTAKTYTKAM
jgi:hypothetical protein